jgi:hypothetical protein
VTYVCILLRQKMLSVGLCCSILTILVQALSSGHALTTIPSIQCSHGNQHICFNPTYCPREQWLEIRSVYNPGNLISRTQVFSHDKPVSMLFDACVAIDKGGCEGTGCEGLARERAYISNDKYKCQGDNSWPCDDVGSYYCPYWSCVSWATWQRGKHAASFTKGKLPDCTHSTCNPINFTVLKPSDCTRGPNWHEDKWKRS